MNYDNEIDNPATTADLILQETLNREGTHNRERAVHRRGFLEICAGAGAIVGETLLAAKAFATNSPFEIIDCHTHFYDPGRSQGVPWPSKDSSLYRKVMPQDLKELPKYRPITGTVIVEASEWIEDNQWLLDLAKDDPFVVGIVGRLDPAAPVFVEQVRRFAKNPLYRGIRVWEDRVRGLLDRGELGSFREMAELGIAADLNGSPEVVPLASKLASLVPSLTIVLNHIGNVAVTKAPPPESWINAIRGAANHQNVYCKISALAEGASRDGNKAPAELDFYRPTIDVVWGAFGDDRVIYGSNWPVSELATDYRTVQKIALDYAFEKGEATAQKFCAGNAAKAYRWVNRPGRVPV